MILTIFYFFAFVMMALFGFVLLKTVLNPATRDETNHRDVNIGIARDRKSLIKDALSKGNIDKDTYEQELTDIETTLADELIEGPNNTQSRIMRGLGVFVILGTLIAVSVTLYQRLGTSVAMQNQYLTETGSVILPNGATVNQQIASALESGADPRTAAEQVSTATAQPMEQSIEKLLPDLEARFAENPDDLEGGMLLARTYMNIGEFQKAEHTLTKLSETEDKEPELMIMLAESSALQNQGELTGKPRELIAKALEIDPNNQRAMLIMALAHQQAGEHEQAIEVLERLKSNANLTPEGEQNIRQMIAQSLAVMNEPENPKENAPIVDANNGSAASGTSVDSSDSSDSSDSKRRRPLVTTIACLCLPLPVTARPCLWQRFGSKCLTCRLPSFSITQKP